MYININNNKHDYTFTFAHIHIHARTQIKSGDMVIYWGFTFMLITFILISGPTWEIFLSKFLCACVSACVSLALDPDKDLLVTYFVFNATVLYKMR